MQQAVVVGGIVVTLFIAGFAVHLLLTWMDRRGWVWYRNAGRGRPSSLGLLEEVYQPSVEHSIQQAVEDETLADQAESGEGSPDDDGEASGHGIPGSPES